MGRAPCCEKVGLKRGRWTTEEDDKLTNYIIQHGEGSWRSLPKNAGLLRCGKSCRLRWINYLRSDLKRGNITPQEEDIIIKLHATMGNRWSTIAGKLPGRTDNEIKNYWNSHLSRRIHRIRKPNGEENVINLSNASAPPKRRGGRTSRAAMQRNKTINVVNNVANNNSKINVNPISSGLTRNTSDLSINSSHNNNNDNSTKNINGNDSNVMPQLDQGPELLRIEDIMGFDGLLESDVNPNGPNESNGLLGVGTVGEDQEQSSGTTASNGGGSTTSSSSSLSCFDHIDGRLDWDMEIGMGDDVGFQLCNEKDQIISWLWENDDMLPNNVQGSFFSDVTNEVNPENEQAMFEWLLS